MAVKAGAFLHVGGVGSSGGFVIDRLQTGGVGSLDRAEEEIKELGNWNRVGIVRDIPTLSFDMESLDVSTEIEALLTHTDPTTVSDGDEIDFQDAVPLDIVSPFKSASNQFDISHGVVVPYLTLENATYRFGVGQNATQSFSFSGDAQYMKDDTPIYEEFSGNGVTTNFSLGNTAVAYTEAGTTIYVLSVCVVFSDGTFQRLYHTDDYTDNATTLMLNDATDAPSGSTIKVTYFTAAAASYPATVHQGTSVKPAAVRSKDVDVYVASPSATTTFTRWTSVQGFEATWSVSLENDEEFGNSHYVSTDYDTPEVSGSITVKPKNLTDLWDKVYQITGTSTSEVVGPIQESVVPVELRVSDPDTGSVLKTIYIPDAIFKVPALQGQVDTKLETTFEFTSEEGLMSVFKADRP